MNTRLQRLLFSFFLLIFHTCSYSQNITFLTHQIEPFSYLEDGEIKGVTTDIIKEMMKITQYNQEIKIFPFARGLWTVQNKPNYAMYIVARRPEREDTVKWVGPLISSGVYFYKRKGSSINPSNLDEIKQSFSVGVHLGNADHNFLKAQNIKNIIPTTKPFYAIKMLVNDRVDLVPMSELTVYGIAEKEKNNIERTNVKLYNSDVYLAFSKETPNNIITNWQNALDEIKSTGVYGKIYQKYLP
ncbi:substrate-binding periplasmic protein [Pseudocolwellia agarivorans]|uniref:substrate-binding periplasmic protein n=1 Tax=Pseudocolwellia agarivorans TaxID=1911682 RepID=UPI0009870BAC|nr:transporter substrate-binding domain-containing protein [Pseudocolwellia agarivorans]